MERFSVETHAPLLRALYTVVPDSIMAELLATTVPTVGYARQKLNLHRKGGNTVRRFVWEFNPERHRAVLGDHLERMRQICWRHLLQSSVSLARMPLEEGDLNPADAILRYRGKIPAGALRELYGISEKSFAKLSRRLNRVVSMSEEVALSPLFRREASLPSLEHFSEAQQQRLHALLEARRKAYQSSVKRKRTAYAAALLARLKKAAEAAGDIATVPCQAAQCKMSWPRTAEFFNGNPDTTDSLNADCKYCSYLIGTRRAPKNKLKRERTIGTKETLDLCKRLPEYSRVIPPGHLRQLFRLSKRQHSRLRRLMKLTTTTDEGNKLLHTWRQLDKCPTVAGLTVGEYSRLTAIWQADKERVLKKFAEADKALLHQLEDEAIRIEREEPEIVALGTKRCEGGCRHLWWRTTYFFAVPFGRYKNYCRHCHRRALREKG